MTRRIALSVSFVLVSLCALCGMAADAADEATVEQLIARLGSAEFAEREDAARRLESQGLAIKENLLVGLEDPDLEIRLRCHEILKRLRQIEIEQQLQAFISDTSGNGEHDLPGWKRFSAIAGDDAAARKLFVEVFRHEREMVDALNWAPEHREAALQNRITETIAGLNGRSGIGPRGVGRGGDADSSIAVVAGALMVAAQDDIKLSVHCDIQFYSMFSQTQVFQLLERAEQRDTLRRMMAAWVARCVKSGNIPQYPLMVALQYDLKESTLKLGREMLAAANNRRGTSTSTLPYLMLAVGKFGDKQDVELLEPLIDNKTVCHTWHTGKHPEPIKIEVRDVALAVLVHLTGQEHKDYGFELLQRYDRTLFSVHTCGYVENEKREAAMAKWRQWSKSRPAE